MGLDMYLSAKKYVGGWKHSTDPMFAQLVKVVGVSPPLGSPSFYIEANVGYWRKANAIHAWFVANVQGGKDDCEHYEVSREQLAALRDACCEVINSVETVEGDVNVGTTYKPGGVVEHETERGRVVTSVVLAARTLPTQGGFFFGKTDYDEHYLQDLEETAEMIDRLLADPALEGWDFYYRSSW